MIQPINDYVLLRAFKEEKGGVVEPETLEGAPEIGIVENTGEVYRFEEANDNHIKVGDKVFFDKFLATEVKDKGEKYYLIKYDDIKAIIKD